jgi:hypothetical protein
MSNKIGGFQSKTNFGEPPNPPNNLFLTRKWEKWSPFVVGILDVTLEGLGEMFEGYSSEMCARKCPLLSMGGRAEGHACTDPGARIPMGGISWYYYFEQN